ncbi:uncharacterized protein SCHCODRAFT_02129560 [Schizophyllum commune H4-8]|uniref:uncharacterized protein n=1 Tax=Schizophyllum commune (strain H4-8 / FGSC 9210) TaxID=578458 RepID=UPI002160676F|nr:uncharacterized protein SCHCODRAFT_02129560 [Schizophyllum commune H4-8]KAI5885030.1 hypothetical protein SCHCODRAFT_02129560 [Schizophyllum commune H4-8]
MSTSLSPLLLAYRMLRWMSALLLALVLISPSCRLRLPALLSSSPPSPLLLLTSRFFASRTLPPFFPSPFAPLTSLSPSSLLPLPLPPSPYTHPPIGR